MALATPAQALTPSSADARADAFFWLLVGTYTGGKSEGLQVCRFDPKTGEVAKVSVARTVNPSFVAASADGRFVYAVNELPGDHGPASQRGGVSAFAFDRASGQLSLLNEVSAEGNDPCHLTISPDGRYLLVACYSVASDPGGSLAVLPIEPDGKLGAAALVLRYAGSGPVEGNQDCAHIHSTAFSPDGRIVYVQDLGADQLHGYVYTPDDGGSPLTPAPWGSLDMPAGTGPRHLLFGQDGRHAYLVNELAATVTVLGHRDTRLEPEQTVPLTDPGFKGAVGGAALHLSADGGFLYVSNRGDANDISIFAVDAPSGRLTRTGRQSSLGETPREFAIDPSGRWLLVGNQNSDTVMVFRRDPRTGLLDGPPKQFDVGSPVDFRFMPA